MENKRIRSPRYPSISLEEAEALARKIYSKDGMHEIDRESAVKHMGYSSLNGASATVLGSLKQYGLVADAGKGTLRLTSLALDLLEPESKEARVAALGLAAFNPDLFASLRDRFPGTIPSESNLRAHLIRQEYTGAAVKSVVPAYLDTCAYLANSKETESYGLPESLASGSQAAEAKEPGTMTDRNAAETTKPTQSTPAPSLTNGRRMIFDTEEGEVAFTYPDNLSEESVEDLEEWFALVAKRLRRATKH